jgi:hypothetical protein
MTIPYLFRTRSRRGSALVLVVVISGILMFSVAGMLSLTTSLRRQQAQRMQGDNALYIAQGILAQGAAWLRVQNTPPASLEGTAAVTIVNASTYTNPDSANYNVDLKVYGQRDPGNQKAYYTMVATAQFKGRKAGANVKFNRRVQSSFYKESLSRYELLVDKSVQWKSGESWVAYYGLGQVFFGPVHSNSGMGLFPNLWFLNTCTSACTGNPPVRQYTKLSPDYWNAVFQKSAAYSYINILTNYSTFMVPPKFYSGMQAGAGLHMTVPDSKVNSNMNELYTMANIKLPEHYGPEKTNTSYNASKGPNFVVEFSGETSANNNGTVTYKQYLGLVDEIPTYGPAYTESLTTCEALIVTGNIVGMSGTIDGRITVGAFDTVTAPSYAGKGQIKLTGNLQYESRLDYQNTYGSPFLYSDAPNLYTNNGQDINLSYVESLKEQVGRVDDVLGLVSEGDVMVMEKDLSGDVIGNGYSNPLYLDCVVLATGASSSGTGDGTYCPENVTTRVQGKVYRFGNMQSTVKQDWDYYQGSGHTNGFIGPSMYDFRMLDPALTPPLFPTTGRYTILPGSYRENYLPNTFETPFSKRHGSQSDEQYVKDNLCCLGR